MHFCHPFGRLHRRTTADRLSSMAARPVRCRQPSIPSGQAITSIIIMSIFHPRVRHLPVIMPAILRRPSSHRRLLIIQLQLRPSVIRHAPAVVDTAGILTNIIYILLSLWFKRFSLIIFVHRSAGYRYPSWPTACNIPIFVWGSKGFFTSMMSSSPKIVKGRPPILLRPPPPFILRLLLPRRQCILAS